MLSSNILAKYAVFMGIIAYTYFGVSDVAVEKVLLKPHVLCYAIEDGDLIPNYKNLVIQSDKVEDQVRQMHEEMTPYLPNNVKLMNITLDDKHCIIVFSKEILNYGGSAQERLMVNQIASSYLSLEGIEVLTVRIHERGTLFVEGSEIVAMTEAQLVERMKEQ